MTNCAKCNHPVELGCDSNICNDCDYASNLVPKCFNQPAQSYYTEIDNQGRLHLKKREMNE